MTTIEVPTISALLEQLRAKRWSDAAIGEELGVSVPTVFRWRKGERTPDIDKLVRLALTELLARP